MKIPKAGNTIELLRSSIYGPYREPCSVKKIKKGKDSYGNLQYYVQVEEWIGWWYVLVLDKNLKWLLV